MNDKMSVLWITLNLLYFQSFWVYVLADVRYKDSKNNSIMNSFTHAITILNLVVVVQFFKISYIGIFKYLLNVGSNNDSLSGLVLIYFRTIKSNNLNIFHLYYFVWSHKAFHLFKIHGQIYFNLIYTEKKVHFINNII